MKKDLEYLTCSGVRTHNLKNINVEIPRDQLVAITGVSGSGKSSLAMAVMGHPSYEVTS